MKHWLTLGLTILMTCLLSCTSASGTKQDLLSVVQEYQSKVAQLIESDKAQETELSRRNSNAIGATQAFDPDKLIPRSTLDDIYAAQIDNSNDVELEYHLLVYKDMLDVILEELEDFEADEVVVNITIQWREGVNVIASVSLTEDRSVMIRMTLRDGGIPIYQAVKFGYDGEDFYIRTYTNYNQSESIGYFEFLDRHSIVSIFVGQNELMYHYINQVDNTLYLYHSQEEGYLLRWYNPVTMVRTTMDRGLERTVDRYEQFNEKGIFFEYIDSHDPDQVLIAWQLLEADGWDAAYMSVSGGPYHGVYLEGSLIPIPARQYNIDYNPSFANVRMDMFVQRSQLNDEYLSLAPFGLSFRHPEVTVASIQAMLQNVRLESEELQTYRGIDFTSDEAKPRMIEIIDPDLLPEESD